MSNHSALADRYALIKSEIEALNKELEKVRFEIKQTGVERLVGERAIVEFCLSEIGRASCRERVLHTV